MSNKLMFLKKICCFPRHIWRQTKTYTAILRFVAILVLLIGSGLAVNQTISYPDYAIFILVYAAIEFLRIAWYWVIVIWRTEPSLREPKIRVKRFSLNHYAPGNRSRLRSQSQSRSRSRIIGRQTLATKSSQNSPKLSEDYEVPVGLASMMLARNRVKREAWKKEVESDSNDSVADNVADELESGPGSDFLKSRPTECEIDIREDIPEDIQEGYISVEDIEIV